MTRIILPYFPHSRAYYYPYLSVQWAKQPHQVGKGILHSKWGNCLSVLGIVKNEQVGLGIVVKHTNATAQVSGSCMTVWFRVRHFLHL